MHKLQTCASEGYLNKDNADTQMGMLAEKLATKETESIINKSQEAKKVKK